MAKRALTRALEAFPVPTGLKLSALWASTMFCYVYGDYFGLFMPGRVLAMNAGRMGPLGPATPAVMLGVSAMMIAPSLMVALSLLLSPAAARWLNVVLGLAYAAIMVLAAIGEEPFYQLFAAVEVVLTLAIVWIAWRWPRAGASA